MDYLHEEEGKVEVLLNPKCHDGHLHAEEGEEQIPPERHGGHLQAEEVEYKVQLITEHMVITCMQKKVKIEDSACRIRIIYYTCIQPNI